MFIIQVSCSQTLAKVCYTRQLGRAEIMHFYQFPFDHLWLLFNCCNEYT